MQVIRKLKNIIHGLNARAALLWHGNPAKKIKVIGITGTDGKTTTSHILYHILKKNNKKVSLISTVYADIGGQVTDTGFHVTTPNPWKLQKLIKQAVYAGDDYLILEVTSHGLDQNRVGGIHFTYGVLTNITHEHLDYHGTYNKYVAAKSKLLHRSDTIIVNIDDESYDYIIHDSKLQNKKTITYGITKGDISQKKAKLTLSLAGTHNIQNALAAYGVCHELGLSLSDVKKALVSFAGIIGRLDEIKTSKPFRVIIDFAHTPNGLEQILKTVRPMTKGNLIHVFGCAGLRDYQKRPQMGALSAQYTDIIVLTEEDYRTEDINEINKQIQEGIDSISKAQKRTKKVVVVEDRQRAFDYAVNIAKKGDIILPTGKGHEQSLCRGTVEHVWSEHDGIARSLKK